MTYGEILREAVQLPVNERLLLVETVMRSVREELATDEAPPFPAELVRGMLKPDEGRIPTDEELREDYVNYLIKKYA